MMAFSGNAGTCLDGEFDSTPSPNNQVFLPSGVQVLRVGEWVERLKVA